jgi:hypothetical protein
VLPRQQPQVISVIVVVGDDRVPPGTTVLDAAHASRLPIARHHFVARCQPEIDADIRNMIGAMADGVLGGWWSWTIPSPMILTMEHGSKCAADFLGPSPLPLRFLDYDTTTTTRSSRTRNRKAATGWME